MTHGNFRTGRQELSVRDSLARAIRDKHWDRARAIVEANVDLFTWRDLPSEIIGVQSQTAPAATNIGRHESQE